MPDRLVARRHLDKVEKDHILELARQGADTVTIARELNIHGSVVNGLITTSRKRGLLPPKEKIQAKPKSEIDFRPATVYPEGLPMSDPTPSISILPPTPVAIQQVPVQQVPAPLPQAAVAATQPAPDHDFGGGRPVLAGSGGFSGSTQQVRFNVERIVPSDGLLGTHVGNFTLEELGQNYGEGTYRITRYEPGKAIGVEYVQKIGPSYGESRSPNAVGHRGFAGQRGGRSWVQRDGGQDDASIVAAQRADRTVYDYARHVNAPSSPVDKAFETLDKIHQRSIDQMDQARKNGPDGYLAKFLEDQQHAANLRWEEERRREEEKRKAEEERWERRQEEDRRRAEERERAEKERYERDLLRIKAESEARIAEQRAAAEDRIRRDTQDRLDRERRESEERKFLLDLEDKKLQLIREEAKIHQDRLESQLKESREEMKRLQQATEREIKETREATAKHIEDSQKGLQDQLERDREQMEREHRIKEKAQDREWDLNKQMLDIQKESMERQVGDQLFNTINTVIREFSKGLEKVVDLQKLKAMTPEAQAAAVARGSIDGNVLSEPAKAVPGATVESAIRVGGEPVRLDGNGHSKPRVDVSQEDSNGETNMDGIIKENLKRPFFQEVIREWSLHVETESDATTFANLYLEMMRDPQSDEGRKACAAFATYMKPRNWTMMFKALRPNLDPDIVRIFERPNAEAFYEAFRAMVVEQIRDYWEQFMISRSGRKPAPAQAASDPQPEVAEAQEAASGVPVPTRESLRVRTSA